MPFLDAPAVTPLTAPYAATGLVITDQDLPADTSMSAVQEWVAGVRG